MNLPKGSPPKGGLGDGEVLKQVRELVTKDAIWWKDHAQRAMSKRGWSRGQVKECLLKGVFDERPYVPNRSGPIEHEFAMRARIDGEQLIIAASLIPETQVKVITIKNKRTRG